MKKRLGLTDEQAMKLKDAVKAHMEANKPFNEHLRSETKALYDQRKSKASNDDIQKTLDSLKSERKGMADENARFQKSLTSFLSATQLAKLREGMLEDMRNRHGGRDGNPETTITMAAVSTRSALYQLPDAPPPPNEPPPPENPPDEPPPDPMDEIQ